MSDTAAIPLRLLMTEEEEALFKSASPLGVGTTEERVARGVAFLDRTQPGWRDRVVVKDLDLSEGCACVLGQVFADKADADEGEDGFEWACDNLFIEATTDGLYVDDVAIFFGFDFAKGVDYYPALQAEWERVLAAKP